MLLMLKTRSESHANSINHLMPYSLVKFSLRDVRTKALESESYREREREREREKEREKEKES